MRLRYPCLSALVLATASFLSLPAMADQVASTPVQMAQAGSEFDFWSSIKDSKKAADYQSYLDKYPNGTFAELAKLRMKKYAAAPVPSPAPAVDPQLADIAYWNSIKASKNVDDYKAYLKKYPNGEFVDLAKLRAEQPSAPIAAPAGPPAQPTSAAVVTTTQPEAPLPATTQPATPEPAMTPATEQPASKLPTPPATTPATMQPASIEPSARRSPAQEMTFEATDGAVYAKNGGEVRAAPDPKAPLIVKLEPTTEVQATGLSTDHRWWRVEVADGQVGFMHHSVVGDQPEPSTEPTMWLPATTQPTLPATTQPTLPITTQPASIGSPANLLTVESSRKESAVEPAGPDEEVCPTTSQVAANNRVAACERLEAKAGPQDEAKVVALGDLAAALVQAGRYDEAIRRYKQAAALAPRDAAIYYDIGLLRLDQLRFAEARAAFEKAAQLDSQNPDIVFQRGVSYIGLGDFDSAKLEVRSALLRKDDAAYYEKLGEIEIARGDLDSAKVALGRGLKADASRRSLILAVVNYYAGDNDTAATQIAFNGNLPTAALWAALINKANGDAAGAAQALEAGRAAFGDTWPGPVFGVLTGSLGLAQARAAAQAKDDNVTFQQLCALNFFSGEWAYLSGDKDAARTALQAALATRAFYTLEFAAARARLAKMGR